MGLFSNLFGSKKEEQIKPVHPPEVKPTAEPPKNPIDSAPKKEVDLTIPEWKDGVERKYYYSVKIQVTDLETLTKRAQEKEFLLNVKDIDGAIHVLSNGDDIGILLDRTDMVQDWLKRGDPYFFCIEHVYPDEPEKEATGVLAFYRDKRKGQDWREQTVVSLTAYKADDKQAAICFCKEGEELELEEDYEHEDAVIVLASGSEIGKLPKKYAVKYLEEDAYGVFFEKTETDNDYNEKPYVRIIWNGRK